MTAPVPFTTSADLDRLVATLRGPVLTAYVSQASLSQDADELTRLVRMHAFDAPLAVLTEVKPDLRKFDDWIARAYAAADVIGTAQRSRVDETISLSVTPASRAAFAAVFAQIYHSACAMSEFGTNAGAKAATTMTRCAMAAAMIDMPDTLDMIVARFPYAGRAEMPLKDLGPAFADRITDRDHSDPQMTVKPMFTALSLSRIESVKTLLKYTDNEVLLGQMDPSSDNKLGLVESLEKFKHAGSEDVFEIALKKVRAGYATDEDLEWESIKILKLLETSVAGAGQPNVNVSSVLGKNVRLLGPVARAGLLDPVAADAVSAALTNGHAEILEHFEDKMPWKELLERCVVTNSPFAFSLCAHPELARRFIQVAIKDKQIENLIETMHTPAGRFKTVEAAGLAQTETIPCMLLLLRKGLSMDAPMAFNDGASSLMQYIEAQSPAAAAAIRSVKARDSLDGLLSTVARRAHAAVAPARP